MKLLEILATVLCKIDFLLKPSLRRKKRMIAESRKNFPGMAVGMGIFADSSPRKDNNNWISRS